MAREWWYNPGDNWLLDDLSGFKIRRSRSSVIPSGQTGGLVVAPERWEPQQPQDLVKGVVDDQTAPLLRTRQQNQFTVLATYVTAGSDRGANTVTVDNPTGFAAGVDVQIMLDSGDRFATSVQSVAGDVLTLTAPLPGSCGLYAEDNAVIGIAANGSILPGNVAAPTF